MPPFEQLQDAIPISDDEGDDGYGSDLQAVSRDLEVLEQKMEEINGQVGEFAVDVTSYRKLLKAAEDRLEGSRDQKEKLVDEKNDLVKRKQRLLQRRGRNRAIKHEAQIPVIASTSNGFEAAKNQATISPAVAASSGPRGGFRAIDGRTTQGQTFAIPGGSGGNSRAAEDQAVRSQTLTAPSPSGPGAAEGHTTIGRTVVAPGDFASGFRAIGGRTAQGQTTQGRASTPPGGSMDDSRAAERQSIGSQALTAPSPSSPGALESQAIEGRRSLTAPSPSGPGAAEGQTTGSRTLAAPSASNFKAVVSRASQRKAIHSPYYEASNSDSEMEEPVIAPQLVSGDRLNIPTNSRTFSRTEISGLIGGKTQGTWCNVNPNRATLYKAGSYMALLRDLNHLLPKAPGLGGGVYVADWLKKEVGKEYQIFVKKTGNNWLYYGKYLISYIQEVSLDEWKKFSPEDQKRWAEHLLEHNWGKNILVKKKIFRSAEHLSVGSSWKEVLKFFNQPDDLPHLRLKLLGLHFIAYDRDLYNNLESASVKLG